MDAAELVERIWARDATLWTGADVQEAKDRTNDVLSGHGQGLTPDMAAGDGDAQEIGFRRLIHAQALGDFAALRERRRPIVRVRLEDL